MKKSMNTILVVILLMITMSVHASNHATLNVYKVGESKLKVEVYNVRGKAVSYIKDKNGEILFERRVKEEGQMMLTFDLSNLPDGSYMFSVEDQHKVETVPFTLLEENVDIHFDEIKRLNFPQLIIDDNKALLKFLSDDNSLKVAIKSKHGEVLYTEQFLGVTGLVGKKFLFEPGEYLVTMSCEDFSTTEYLIF